MAETKQDRVERRTFMHKGKEVDEQILKEDESMRQIVWCLHPFEQTLIDGAANPLFHVRYAELSGVSTVEARDKVRIKFEEYYRLE